MIPLMTRRSSTLGLPRVSLGRCGLSCANCSSLSQKESRSINGLPSETLDHDAPRFGNQFMGPEPNEATLWRRIVRTTFGGICLRGGIALGVLYFLVVAYARAHPEEYGTDTISVSESLKISAIPAIV